MVKKKSTKGIKQLADRKISKDKVKSRNPQSPRRYGIEGMHCSSCSILIEKAVRGLGDFKDVDVSRKENKLSITLKNKTQNLPSLKELNKAVNSFGYKILDYEENSKQGSEVRGSNNNQLLYLENGSLQINREKFESIIFVFLGLIVIYFLYKIFGRWGITLAVNVHENSALSVFFLFGVVAGISSCFALVGSIVLSMSKKWYESYGGAESTLYKMYPHLFFNTGRLSSFFIFGGLLGLLGEIISISENLTASISILVALIIIINGFELLGLRLLPEIKLRKLKEFSLSISENKRAKSNIMQKLSPFLTGFFTFFIPCGFTLTVQGLAVLSSNFLTGALIMGSFALGTIPVLLLVGFSTTRFYSNNNLAKNFAKLVAVLIILFGLFTVNLQLVRLGLPSFQDMKLRIFSSSDLEQKSGSNENLPPVIDGIQIIKSQASAYGYTPETIHLRKGIPVRWEITDIGTSGCSNAIIAKDFFEGKIELTPGSTSTKEFTPQKVGTFRYSCWMGMIQGTIIVVE